MALIEPSDLEPFATIDPVKAQAMIADALAMAVLAAPCLDDPEDLDEQQAAAAKAVLRAAILRWHETGTGAFSQQSAGPFSATVDTRQTRRGMFWPTELAQLQDICATGQDPSSSGDAFMIDQAVVQHRDDGQIGTVYAPHSRPDLSFQYDWPPLEGGTL